MDPFIFYGFVNFELRAPRAFFEFRDVRVENYSPATQKSLIKNQPQSRSSLSAISNYATHRDWCNSHTHSHASHLTLSLPPTRSLTSYSLSLNTNLLFLTHSIFKLSQRKKLASLCADFFFFFGRLDFAQIPIIVWARTCGMFMQVCAWVCVRVCRSVCISVCEWVCKRMREWAC